MKINKQQLYFDLLIAFYGAKKGKSNRWYVKEFEKNLDENLNKLADDILSKRYVPSPFYVFVVEVPKAREIFAAEFVDRIVHHLYYNYVHEYFERTFIYDCYSSIKGRGTSFGISRLRHHIESCSLNYTVPCYVLKMDIRSYFPTINKRILLDIVTEHLYKFDKKYPGKLDLDLLLYLSEEIILLDPTLNAIPTGRIDLFKFVKKFKSLFTAKPDCGIPAGNLTSQLFSNIFLNCLDQYVKRVLHIKHYGRFVDDFFIVSRSKEELRALIPKIEEFLKVKLSLDIHKGKTFIRNVLYGVEFLGAYLKKNRTYISNKTLARIKKHNYKNRESYISEIGILRNYKSLNIRKELFLNEYNQKNNSRIQGFFRGIRRFCS